MSSSAGYLGTSEFTKRQGEKDLLSIGHFTCTGSTSDIFQPQILPSRALHLSPVPLHLWGPSHADLSGHNIWTFGCTQCVACDDGSCSSASVELEPLGSPSLSQCAPGDT